MLKIRITGSQEVIKTLKETKKRLTDYREYFEDQVTPALFKRFDEVFQKEGAINGKRWRRLRPATLAEKRSKGYRLEILRRTDRLYNAYTGKNSYGRILIYPQSLVYKNFVPYAIYHETGTSRGLPKRTTVARIVAFKGFRQELTNRLNNYLSKP